MKRLLAMLMIGIFTGCNNIVISKKETSAVQEVLNFYGGICNRIKGFSHKNGETENYFKLEMSKSDLLEQYTSMLDIPASNIAYIFYKNLGDEKGKYTHIKVKINLNNGQDHEYKYSTKELKEIQSFEPILLNTPQKVKDQDYTGLIKTFDDSIAMNLTESQLRSLCSSVDSTYGDIKEIQFQGFAFANAESDGKPLIYLAGVMVREKENTQFSLFVNRKNKKLYNLKYKF